MISEQVALDDFGTGHNDVDAVDYYNPHTVKLDRTLIAGIDEHISRQNDVKYYIRRFHEKGIKVLAEGIETKEEYSFLLEAGIDYYQGYYLARPA